jgi:hypothetical protein
MSWRQRMRSTLLTREGESWRRGQDAPLHLTEPEVPQRIDRVTRRIVARVVGKAWKRVADLLAPVDERGGGTNDRPKGIVAICAVYRSAGLA